MTIARQPGHMMTNTTVSDTVRCTDLTVHDDTWGKIYLHNRHHRDTTTYDSHRIVILQHGATYGSTAFATRLDGLSWMDYLALRGFDVYCLDLPGYGKSQRPAQMDQPAQDNVPFMRTPDAAQCLASVIDYVCERRGTAKVCLIGWSWGTAISSYYTAQNADRVERLVLYAPIWDRTHAGPSSIHVDATPGAYRTVSREATLARRHRGLPEHLRDVVLPPRWFEQWWQATAATDPTGAGESIRAPNGVVQDGIEYWNRAKPLYEPQRLTVPLLIVVGEWDKDTPSTMAQTLFPLCNAAPWKRLAVLSGGTHTMLMERNRILLFRTAQQFLEEAPPAPDSLE